jgi:hypothetical protein
MALPGVVLVDGGELAQEGVRVVGGDDLRRRGERLALVLRDDVRGHLVADRVDPLLLTVEVGLERVEPLRGLREPEPRVVVALGGDLRLVVEVVDPLPDVADRRLRRAGC